jgi:energy-coupling factor transporter ATP-binding protein EcfA2
MREETDVSLPLHRFRFFGIRKLNWATRDWNEKFEDHLQRTGLDKWLTLGHLTVVIGPNGGGKTTVVDLLRALSEPNCWPGLPRENYPGDDFSGFDVEGTDWMLGVRFSKYTKDLEDTYECNSTFIVGKGPESTVCVQLEIPKYRIEGPWCHEIRAALAPLVRFPTRYLPSVGPMPGSDLSDEHLVRLLNELSKHFPSVFANPKLEPFQRFKGAAQGPGRIGVLFKDDGGQHAFVDRELLPLGWLQLAGVLAFMRQCEHGSLVLLDEPDRHLHPSLQRTMLELVAKEQHRLDAQVVLATHSSVLLNPELCTRVGARVIVAARGRCEQLTDGRGTLDDLGVTSGDLVQANGLIWVEGPSDRIYIKSWLERRAEDRGKAAPIERVHYGFVTYGGALLKHLTLADEDSHRVAVRSINRNFVVVIDRDLAGDSTERISAEKQRVLAEATALDQHEAVWITQGYTIENYLPESYRNWLRTDAQGRTKVRGLSKVELASRFRNEQAAWSGSFRADTDLGQRIDGLLDVIEHWQTPQEYIEPAFLPPWLRDEA